MAKNFSNQLVGQIGENLVVAELGRRSVVATTFARNVPDIDILAFRNGKTAALQVKAWKKGDVSFNAADYISIRFEDKKQIVEGYVDSADDNLIFVFVKVAAEAGDDAFFILTRADLKSIIDHNYRSFLSKHNGIRPRNYETTHCAVTDANLVPYKDNWALIEKAFEPDRH